MINNPILKQRLDAVATTDDQFLIDYNAETIEVNAPVLIADLAQYVDPEILPRLLAAKDNPGVTGGVRVCVNAALELRKAPYKDFSVRSLSFLQSMAVLQNAGILTSAHVDGLLALGTRYTSESMIDHGQATEQSDIDAMRLEPKRLKLEQLMAEASAAHGELESGRDVDLIAWGITNAG